MSKQGVYKIENTITKEIYIGSAVRCDYRRWSHLHSLRKGIHKNHNLQEAYDKYGENAFVFIEIEEVADRNDLFKREQFYLDTLNPTYNIQKNAESALGMKHSDKSKKNMSDAHKNQTKEQRGHKEGCKCCLCFRLKGKDSSNYIKREERFCACGCKKSFTCMITSKKKFVIGHNKSSLGKTIPILQYDLDGIFVKEWISSKEASLSLKVSQKSIIDCCKNKRSSSTIYKWKYKNITI